jgi:hypothetical protein
VVGVTERVDEGRIGERVSGSGKPTRQPSSAADVPNS